MAAGSSVKHLHDVRGFAAFVRPLAEAAWFSERHKNINGVIKGSLVMAYRKIIHGANEPDSRHPFASGVGRGYVKTSGNEDEIRLQLYTVQAPVSQYSVKTDADEVRFAERFAYVVLEAGALRQLDVIRRWEAERPENAKGDPIYWLATYDVDPAAQREIDRILGREGLSGVRARGLRGLGNVALARDAFITETANAAMRHISHYFDKAYELDPDAFTYVDSEGRALKIPARAEDWSGIPIRKKRGVPLMWSSRQSGPPPYHPRYLDWQEIQGSRVVGIAEATRPVYLYLFFDRALVLGATGMKPVDSKGGRIDTAIRLGKGGSRTELAAGVSLDNAYDFLSFELNVLGHNLWVQVGDYGRGKRIPDGDPLLELRAEILERINIEMQWPEWHYTSEPPFPAQWPRNAEAV